MTRPTLIAVDIGNSLTKVGWFDDGQAVGQDLSCQLPAGQVLPYAMTGLPQPKLVREFLTGQPPPTDISAELAEQPTGWRVASVNREGQQVLAEWVKAYRPQDEFQVLTRADLPIAVRVDHPDRVGVDRLVAAIAANALRETGRPAIVICAGTAVTVNLVEADGAFAGGAILAGFRMQAESLFQTADLLPLAHLIPQDEPPPVVGRNTEAAIRSGLFWGAVGAVRELVERMAADLSPTPQVFVAGGDLQRLAPLVGEDVKFVPNMVLAGIAIAARRA